MDSQSLIAAANELAPTIGFVGVPAVWAISARRAITRLVGAAVEIPATWLDQTKALMEAEGRAKIQALEAVTGQAVGFIQSDDGVGQRAAKRLVAKEYRRQTNVEAVAIAALDNLRLPDKPSNLNESSSPDVDEDWLNAFERLAEDASSEKARVLWGKVLAGKIKNPDAFSLRTMQILPLISPNQAEKLTNICRDAFGDFIPKAKIMPKNGEDITELIHLESIGLIEGVAAGGFQKFIKFNEFGFNFLIEGDFAIQIKSQPNSMIRVPAIILTPLSIDIMSLMDDRDVAECARRVANEMRTPQINQAYLGKVYASGIFVPTELLWDDSVQGEVVTE